MTNFRCQVFGLLGAAFPWSVHMTFTGAVTEAAAEAAWKAANDTFWSTAGTPTLSHMNAEVTVNKYQTATMNATFHQTTVTEDLVAHAGTNVHDSLPWDSSMVCTFRSALSRKTGRGRWFLPPLSNDNLVAHKYTAGTCNNIAANLTALRAAMTAAGLTQITYNANALVDHTPAFTIETIIGGDIPDKPASQDKRTSKIVPTRYAFT